MHIQEKGKKMKPTPSLCQLIKPCEYVFQRGIKAYERAETLIDEYISESEISFCENPRVQGYGKGKERRYAIVLTDTNLIQYL